MTDDGMSSTTLSNGVRMPAVAFGCAFGDWVGATDFQGFLPEQGWRALTLAFEAGYRAFDGAHVYGTERILGDVLGREFSAGRLSREDVFITTKLAHPSAPPHINISHLRTWDANAVPDVAQQVKDDMAKTLDDLCLGYVDLALVHWPGPFSNQDSARARRARRVIWTTFVELLEKGATRAIGVSNFSVRHLQELIEDVPHLKPMVNQLEIHPYCRDSALESFCKEHGMVISAYAPFASGAFGMLQDPILVSIAKRHGVSAGQVVLRWHIQSGRTVLPKSSKLSRMRENLDLFSFALSEEDMDAIDGLGAGEARRTCPDPESVL